MTSQEKIWKYHQNPVQDSFAGSSARQQALVRHLRPGEKVLNIGVGAGVLEQLAKSKGVSIYALDPDEQSIERLRQTLGLDQELQVGFAQELPFNDEMFDVVVMSEVLEHLEDSILNQSLIEIYRVLGTNGRFIGTVPAREDLEKNKTICPDCGHIFHRWGHARSFSKESLTQTLQGEFEVREVKETLFTAWGELNFKGKLFAAIKQMLLACGVHGSGEVLFFQAVKKTNPAA